MRKATLVYLIDTKAKKILLADKKRGFGKEKWNGIGGKVDQNETIEEALVRETKEEILVELSNFKKYAEFKFYFEDKPDWGQNVHVYLGTKWKGIPAETEEMKPQWFEFSDIPYTKMWESDQFWLPMILAGHYVEGEMSFDKNTRLATMHLDTKLLS